MTLIDTIVESVKNELGSPVVTLYIKDEQIKTLINKAIRKCSEKACPVHTMDAIVVDGKIDLTGKDVYVVKNVYRPLNAGSYKDPFGLIGATSYPVAYDQGVFGRRYLDEIADIGYLSQARHLQVPDFYLDGETLYVDNYEGNVTIEYLKKNLTLEDLDVNWQSWVEDYTTAMAKMVEGRIRGKFRPQSAPFEVDYQDLLSEGQSEMQELEQKLDMAIGYYNILR